jgi:phosphoserine phosphatase RsbU/P
MNPDNEKLLSFCREIWISSAVDFTLAVIITIFGIVVMLIHFLNRKHSAAYILYIGIFSFLYGIRILASNEMIVLLNIFSPAFLGDLKDIITYFLGVFSTLIFAMFIGWGWKRSLFWLLLVQAAYGVMATALDLFLPGNSFTDYPVNNILVLVETILVMANIFLTRMTFRKEVFALLFGIGIFILAAINENMVDMHLLPWTFKIEWPAFFIFICSLTYVAVRRSLQAERELILVNRDMENARQILSASLPRTIPSPPEVSVSVSFRPMELVGGDFYDFYYPDGGSIGVLVADVSGHGLPAALIASMLKIAFSGLGERAASPVPLFDGLNKALCNQLNQEFITLAYVYIDPATKAVSFSTAGHPPVLHFRKRSGEVKELRCAGIPVGISPDAVFSSGKSIIEKGDRIVLYTDGIIEAADDKGNLFGRERLIRCLGEFSNVPPGQAAKSITDRAFAWSAKRKKDPGDDITCIVIDIL